MLEVLIWTLSSLIGFLVSVWNLWGSVLDWRAIRRVGITNGRAVIATSEIRREAVRTYIQAVFLLVGAVAFASGAQGGGSSIAWVFISVSVILALDTALSGVIRRGFTSGRWKV